MGRTLNNPERTVTSIRDDRCDVCRRNEVSEVVASHHAPFSYGRCPDCSDAGHEPLYVLTAALRVLRSRNSDPNQVTDPRRAARRLLALLDATTIERGVTVPLYASDAVGEPRPRLASPVTTGIEALRRFHADDLSVDQTIDAVVSAIASERR